MINRYARMQEHSSTANLTFDIVVPEATSTRHVAAAAFYHCLGGCAFKTFPDLARFPSLTFFGSFNHLSNSSCHERPSPSQTR